MEEIERRLRVPMAADEEVAKLVEAMREQADDARQYTTFYLLHRAADLLERQALAELGPETPTDKELLEMMAQSFRDDLAAVSRMAAHGAGPDITPGLFRVSLNTGALDFARAVLARWGAADKEAAERALRPIPVSERLPGPEDCLPWPGEPDETPWCWAFVKGPLDDDSWERRPVTCLTTYKSMHTHWLPAHALPLPEVNDD